MSNKGELSEIYAVSKLVENPFISVIDPHYGRESKRRVSSILVDDKIISIGCNDVSVISCDSSNFVRKILSVEERSSISSINKCFLDHILNMRCRSDVSFEANRMSNVIGDILGIRSIKAKNKFKHDLTLVYSVGNESSSFHDVSIKSFLGSNPTLFNASKDRTTISYKIKNKSDYSKILSFGVEHANVRDIIKLTERHGIFFDGFRIKNEDFEKSLKRIMEPSILSECVKLHYIKKKTCRTTSLFLEDVLSSKYPYFKTAWTQFLRSSALSVRNEFTSSNRSHIEISDNYLIVSNSGSLNLVVGRQKLEDVLYDNSFIDTPSKIRHGVGNTYEEDGEFWFDLNFQIRLLDNIFDRQTSFDFSSCHVA